MSSKLAWLYSVSKGSKGVREYTWREKRKKSLERAAESKGRSPSLGWGRLHDFKEEEPSPGLLLWGGPWMRRQNH